MKTALSSILLGCLVTCGNALAQNTLTVDNNPGSVAMYSNFADAYAAAQPGDTILLAGSPTSYGIHTIHKRLRIEGPGYLLSENNVPGLTTRSARFEFLSYEKSAQYGDPSNSTIIGIETNIVVEPGIQGLRFDKLKGWFDVESPVTITRSYVTSLFCKTGSSGSITTNSIINGIRSAHSGDNSISVSNCVVIGLSFSDNNTSNLAISNSIFTYSTVTFASQSHLRPTISHCIGTGNYLPEGSGNLNGQFLVGPGGLFEKFESNKDFVELRSDSPAKGAGSGGIDIGATGGPTPYIPGGVPARPRLTLLSAPNAATNASGLTFTVGAQAFGD